MNFYWILIVTIGAMVAIGIFYMYLEPIVEQEEFYSDSRCDPESRLGPSSIGAYPDSKLPPQ